MDDKIIGWLKGWTMSLKIAAVCLVGWINGWIMAHWINGCMAAWAVICMDRLMPPIQMTDWIGVFVDELMIRCLGSWNYGPWVDSLLMYKWLDGSMDIIMARRINVCMAGLVVRWTDRLMPLGWMTDWIGSFVDEWMVRCLGGWKDGRWVHRLLMYKRLDGSMDIIMALRMNVCMVDLVVRWTDRLMPLGWMTYWIDSFEDEWMVR